MTNICLRFEQTNFLSTVPSSACTSDENFRNSQGIVLETNKCGQGDKIHFVTNSIPNPTTIRTFDTCGKTAGNLINNSALIGNITDVTVVGCCDGFEIESNGATGCSRLISTYRFGAIAGYNEDVNVLFSQTKVNLGISYNFISVAYYKKHIYAVELNSRTIIKFDKNWNQVDSFTDEGLTTAGYSPYIIRVIRHCGKKKLAVTFGFLGFVIEMPVGYGFVDLFSSDGSFTRLINMGPLSLPSAVFNFCLEGKNYIGVGNRSNGRINFFDECGTFISPAYDKEGNILSIDGLTGVAVDPEKAVLYFTAIRGVEDEGLFGRLTLVQ